MVTEFKCDKCKFECKIGDYHYHPNQPHYFCATWMVCRFCGVIHHLDHAMAGGVPGKMTISRAGKKISYMLPKETQVTQEEWNLEYRYQHEATLAFTTKMETVCCGSCDQPNALIQEAPLKHWPCPRCKKGETRAGDMWLT